MDIWIYGWLGKIQWNIMTWKKKKFYSHLNMEDITDADYAHAKRVCKGFKIENLVDYHDFYVQIDTLLLVDIFKNFRNMCLWLYKLDPAHYFPQQD